LSGNFTTVENYNVTQCGELGQENGVYRLMNDVNTNSTCFNITADNVTLDCNNYIINFSKGGPQFSNGVYSNQNRSKIYNCKIYQGDSRFNQYNRGIYVISSGSEGIEIINNFIYVFDYRGIEFQFSTFSNSPMIIKNNRINSTWERGIMIQWGASNINISNNTINSYDTGIYFNGNNRNINCENNFVNTFGTSVGLSYSSGVNSSFISNYIYGGMDMSGIAIIKDNYVKSINNIGIYLAAQNSVMINNTGISLSNFGIGVYESNIILINNTASSNSSFAIEVYTNNNISIINQNVTGVSSSSGGYLISDGNNIIIKDCITIQYGYSAINVTGNVNNLTILNCSYDSSKEFVKLGGNLTRNWYLDVNVSNLTGQLDNAQVNSSNSSGILQDSDLTTSSGIVRQELVEYVNIGGSRTYYSPYTLNVTKSNYTSYGNNSVNLSGNKWMDANLDIFEEIPIIINILYPVNGTIYNYNVSNINYSVNVTDGSCWYSLNSGNTNSSALASGINFTNVVSVEGINNWIVYCNDSSGNMNSSLVIYYLNRSLNITQTIYQNQSGVVSGTVVRGDNITINATIVNATVIDRFWIKIWQGAIGASQIIWQGFMAFISGNLWSVTIPTNSSWNIGEVNYTVYSNDTIGQEVNLSGNFTTLAQNPLVIIIGYPVNNSQYNYYVNSINYSIIENSTSVDKCRYSNSSGNWNSSIVNAGNNFTNVSTKLGENNFIIWCNESNGNTNYSLVNFNVTIDSYSPVIDNFSELFVCEDEALNYYFNVSDDDSNLDISNYSIIPEYPLSPFYLNYNSQYNLTKEIFYLFSGIITKSNVGGILSGYRIYNENISFTDGESITRRNFNITLIGINHAPIIENIPSNITLYISGGNTTYNFIASSSDIEDGTNLDSNLTYNISFSATNLFNIGSNGSMFFNATNSSELGVHDVTICVIDRNLTNIHTNISYYCSNSGLSKSNCTTFSLIITNENRAPQILSYYPNLNLSVNGNSAMMFNVSSIDYEGTIPNTYWYINNILEETDTNNTLAILSHTFGCGVSGYHNVTAFVSDGNLSSSISWNISVTLNPCTVTVVDSGGGGGGGGGGAPSYITYTPNKTELENEYIRSLRNNDRFKLNISNNIYYLILSSQNSNNVEVYTLHDMKNYSIKPNGNILLDLDNNNQSEIIVNFLSSKDIYANISVKTFIQEIKQNKTEVKNNILEEELFEEAPELEKGSNRIKPNKYEPVLITIGIIIAAILVSFIIYLGYRAYKIRKNLYTAPKILPKKIVKIAPKINKKIPSIKPKRPLWGTGK
jgi:hypothetical protein